MIVLGLTGSIGMGKSTTADLFRSEGVAVFDADLCVHALYRGAAYEPVNARFPSVVKDGSIDRALLGALVLNDPVAMADLERIIHPAVAEARRQFLQMERSKGAAVAVVDVPLLFETGGFRQVDAVAVVSASSAEQRRRVLARPGMTEAKFLAIQQKQMPDAEKRHRSHFLIQTDRGLEAARRQIGFIIAALRQVDR